MSGYIFLAFVVGYLAGHWHWKKLADEAIEIAGRAILACEAMKEQMR